MRPLALCSWLMAPTRSTYPRIDLAWCSVGDPLDDEVDADVAPDPVDAVDVFPGRHQAGVITREFDVG